MKKKVAVSFSRSLFRQNSYFSVVIIFVTFSCIQGMMVVRHWRLLIYTDITKRALYVFYYISANQVKLMELDS